MEFLKSWHAVGQGANRRGGVAPFAMKIDAETAQPGDAIGSVGNQGFAVEMESVTGEGRKSGGFNVESVQRGRFDFAQFALDADARGRALDEQKVATGTSHQCGQPLVQARGSRGGSGFGGAPFVQLASQSIEFP